MNYFVARNKERTEEDDFKLNIQSIIDDTNEAVPQYNDDEVIGWVIQKRYE